MEFKEIIPRIVDAVVKRIEGGDDPRKKFDYLTKLDDDTVKSLSNLSEGQLDAIAESQYLGEAFPSLKPLADFSLHLAKWSPSKSGKRAEQLTATMISQTVNVNNSTSMLDAALGKNKDKKQKESEKD